MFERGNNNGNAQRVPSRRHDPSQTQRHDRRCRCAFVDLAQGSVASRCGALAAILCSMRSLFHLAFHVTDLDAARHFYGGVLGCQEGRSTDTWVDFDFFGHQISLHLGAPFASAHTGHVGDHMVPMPHLGAILELPDWHALAARLKAANTAFVLAPQVRFEGEPGEQWTMFFYDPSGNPIEIKGFRSLDAVYAS